MSEFLLTLLGGGVGVAVAQGVMKLADNFMLNHTAKGKEKKGALEKKVNDNADKIVAIDSTLVALRHGFKHVLHDRIKHLARTAIAKGEISYDDRRDLLEMHAVYHNELGGNGNLDDLIADMKEVTVK